MRSFHPALLLLATLGCADPLVIVDDWGPPAGYAAVEGVVRDTTGAIKSGASVRVTLCTDPIGGFLGQVTSAQDGSYRVSGMLPPVGVMPQLSLDTLHVACSIGAGVENATIPQMDSITVRFYATPEEVVPLTRDLTFR